MKALSLFFLLSFSLNAYSVSKDPRVGRPNPNHPTNNEFRDEVVRGESTEEHRAQAMPGNHQDLNTGSIKGTHCIAQSGKSYAPKTKGYKECVDYANRVK